MGKGSAAKMWAKAFPGVPYSEYAPLTTTAGSVTATTGAITANASAQTLYLGAVTVTTNGVVNNLTVGNKIIIDKGLGSQETPTLLAVNLVAKTISVVCAKNHAAGCSVVA